MSDMDLILPEEEPKSAKEAAKRAKQLAEEEAKVEAAEAEAQKAKAASMEDAAVPAEELAVEPAEESEKMGGEDHHHHHHHSHHEHHHNSSGNQKKHRKRKSKFSRFLRYNKKKLLWALLAVVLVVALLLLALFMDRRGISSGFDGSTGSNGQSQTDSIRETISSLQVEVPLFTQEVPLVVPGVTAYLKSNVSIPANEVFERYEDDDSDECWDRGLPVTLSYSIKGMPDGYSVKTTQVLISEKSDFSGAKQYTLTGTGNQIEVHYLKTGTTYYYRFDLTLSTGTVTGVSGSFTTAKSPRILKVDGISNVRDIGGWSTLDGNRVKQGLLYRGTELEGAIDPSYRISDTGVSVMLTEFGIRTEMDLRPASDNVNGIHVFGPRVEHLYYNAPSYEHVFAADWQESVKRLFTDLADESKYPVYLHCTHGLDRTGTMCYILGALLGMSEEDLMREYQLSSLHHGSLWTLDELDGFITRFKGLEGNTMQEKAENYLLSIGVTWDQITGIRSILLEK